MRITRGICALFLLLTVLCDARLLNNSVALATTGPNGDSGVPALYKVPHNVAILYPGQYIMKMAASAARLSTGQMAIDINAMGYLQGVASFRGYDSQGFPTTWVAGLYNFHLTSPNHMTVDVQNTLGTTLFGRMYLQRTKSGDLVGQIALPKTPYSIAFHRNIGL